MSKFNVGDHVIDQNGNKGVVTSVRGTAIRLHWDGGVEGSTLWQDREFSLVQPAGPVRTETVTKRRIVLGVYGPVTVLGVGNVGVDLNFANGHYSASDLDSLAMVASQLAEALRDLG